MTAPQQVTIDRIAAACAAAGIEIAPDATGRAAHGAHEGLTLLVVLLDSVFIVRADSATDVPTDSPDATFYLAANEVNTAMMGARAVVANKGEVNVIRTESEVPCAAGLTDDQLAFAATAAVASVVEAHNAMVVMCEQVRAAREAAAGDEN